MSFFHLFARICADLAGVPHQGAVLCPGLQQCTVAFRRHSCPIPGSGSGRERARGRVRGHHSWHVPAGSCVQLPAALRDCWQAPDGEYAFSLPLYFQP